MNTQNKRLIGIMAVVGVVLSIPFLAMKLGSEMKWGPFDFVVAGVLLIGTGLAFEFVLRTVQRTSYRLALFAGVLLALFLVWAELAVGLFGTRFAGS